MRWLLLAVLVGCVDAPAGDTVVSRVERLVWAIEPPRRVDILFVVDNSPAMAAHEETWIANHRHIIQQLELLPGGLPDVHIGVVTTDLGTLGADGQSGAQVAGCTARGDRGNLRVGGAAVQGSFLVNRKLGTGARQVNYTGSLVDAFSTIATVGTDGCPYVQPLEAMKRALDRNPVNAGFVRENAWLWIILVTPNDDCSFSRGGFAVESASINAHACVARDAELVEVDRYATFAKGLKQDPSTLVVSVIAGPSGPVRLVNGPEGLEVAPSCMVGGASALPAGRSMSFAQRFPSRSSFTTICQQNLSDTVSVLSGLPERRLANQCFARMLVDTDATLEGLQANCSVSYRFDHGGEQLVPACGAESQAPCWHVVVDPQRCTMTPSLQLEIVPALEPITERTLVVADCIVE